MVYNVRMVSEDLKRRLVLSDAQVQILCLVVSTLRHSRDSASLETDCENTHDVLHALTFSGYAVLPQGTIDAIKKLLTDVQPLPSPIPVAPK